MKKDHDGLSVFKAILSKVGIKYVPSYGSKHKRCVTTKNSASTILFHINNLFRFYLVFLFVNH